MRLYLVHHAEAVGPEVDSQRPLSIRGRAQAQSLADRASIAGCTPSAIWHSGKLRARQTAEAFYRTCSPFAEFRMIRGLLPSDPPTYLRDAVSGEARDILAAGHMPNLREALRLLAPESVEFPLHGLVALETADEGGSWRETWRLASE